MRFSRGYVRKQRGSWIGAYYVQGKRTSKTLGLVKDLTKSEAREKLAELIKASQQTKDTTLFGPFIEGPYFGFYGRKWKHSTQLRNTIRVRAHLAREFHDRDLASFNRDELQDFLDSKANNSHSLVAKLRFDLKQIFNMAQAEGLIQRNPALLLFTPRSAKRPTRRVLTIEEIIVALGVLERRERLAAKLAVLAGMRPGEIFALPWDDIKDTHAEVTQGVYEGIVDTPKSHRGIRQVALSAGLLQTFGNMRKKHGAGPKHTFSLRSAGRP
jgi:integrase